MMLTRKGFTLVEIVVAMFVFATLSGVVTINLLRAQSKTSLDTELSALLAEIKNQQTLAMSGNIQNGSDPTDYGIYFGTNSYTVFSGSSYTVDNSTNFVVSLRNNVSFSSVSFPSNTIIFQRASGEIANFNSTQNQFSIISQGGEQKTVTLNRYGVFTSIQ